MRRIEAKLKSLKDQGRKALVPYIVAGDPVPALTLRLLHALVDSGADILEIGVPFSDPMAEGPVIQLGHERALRHQMSLTRVLELVAEFRKSDNDTPIVLMGYANPVETMGYKVFADRACKAGVDGVLTVDLPPEEATGLNAELNRVGIDTIFLIAPTTTQDRMDRICAAATGYLYYVSLKGVTGAGHLNLDSVACKLQQIKMTTSLPVCVGFGIKDAASARSIGNLAEGVVVGSVLVNKIAELGGEARWDAMDVSATENLLDIMVSDVAELLAEMRTALDTL